MNNINNLLTTLNTTLLKLKDIRIVCDIEGIGEVVDLKGDKKIQKIKRSIADFIDYMQEEKL